MGLQIFGGASKAALSAAFGPTAQQMLDAFRPFVGTFTVDPAYGNGTTDATAHIQSKIDAAAVAGGVVSIPPGTFKLTSALVQKSLVSIVGAGENVTTLKQTSSSANGIQGVDLQHVALKDLRVLGPGPYTGTGQGITYTLSGTAGNATFYVEMRNVRAEEFGMDGVNVSTPIVSEFARVQPFKNGRHGIHFYGAGEADGTSCSLTACFPAGNHGAGIRLKQMAYTSLNGCAGDANGIAYEYDTCVGITENGCGSEEPYDFSAFQAGYSGFSRKIFNSKVVLNSPYAIGNILTAYWVTNGSLATINSLYEGSPGNPDSVVNTPTNSLLVDAGCTVYLNGNSVVTPLNLAAGTTKKAADALDAPGVATLTNKRVTKRVDSTASAGTYTFSWDNFDAAKITAQAAALTIANPTGTPTPMQPVLLRIKDNGTARAITFGTQWHALGVTLPATTVLGKITYIFGVWNNDASQIDVLAVGQEA